MKRRQPSRTPAAVRRLATLYRPRVEQLEDRLPPGQLWSLLGTPEFAASRPGSARQAAEPPHSSATRPVEGAPGVTEFGLAFGSGFDLGGHGTRAGAWSAAWEFDAQGLSDAFPSAPASGRMGSAQEARLGTVYAGGDSTGLRDSTHPSASGALFTFQVSPTEQAILEAVAALPSAVDLTNPPAGRGLLVDLVADTNRDGIVTEDDEDGKDNWTPQRGTIYAVNFDDDNSNGQPDAVNWNDQGRPFGENRTIENAQDVLDQSPLVIRALGAGYNPTTMRVYLRTASVEDAQSIHVFPALTAGTQAVLGDLGTRVVGGTAAATRADITSYVSATSDATFGVEGMNFRYVGAGVPAHHQFDGYIDLTLEVEQNSQVIGSSTVRMKVAPWIMSTHAENSQEVWAVNLGSTNAPFLFTGSASPGYYGIDATGHLRIASGSERWVQDHGEAGWTQRPGGPLTQVSFRLPYYRGGSQQPPWMQQSLLRPNWATFQLGNLLHNFQDYKGDYGGNLEAFPPMPGHPLGRIVQGNLRSDVLAAFMTSQEVQTPNAAPPTRWLRVGHIDEMITFLPGHKVMIADTREAYRLMEELTPAERGAAVYFAQGAMPITGTATAGSTTTRLMTGMNLTGQNWQYVRIYAGTGAGQVARVAPGGLGNGFIDINAVWDTGTQVRPFNVGQGSSFARLPQAGDQFVLVEGSRTWGGTTPGFITVHEVLNDTAFRTLNTQYVQGQLDLARQILEQNDAPADVLQFLSVPVLYSGTAGPSFATSRSAVAFTPGAENSYPLGWNGGGEQTIYVPRQFGPRNGLGQDIFETAVLNHVPTARFVDGWNSYHILDGEIHCGILAPRSPAGNWWTA